ncbi:NAD(P)-dependent oxidoreductase [Candidatus Pelagibacter sp.]|nr:NAD(P)-dependent oxidoreductase [Candidatus Pelagibacter sp.]|tara:strand:+ start:37 stop:888 length:852 start_codon:yes stop_codon:yes gene_type:complete
MTRILVTGATGFVGKQVIRALSKTESKITIVARKGKENQFSQFSNIESIISTTDIFAEEIDWWTQKCKNIDIIIHLAWYVEPGLYLNSTKNLDCTLGSLKLAKGAIKAGVKRFLSIGSCLEYDLSAGTLSVDTPLKPTTLYAKMKTELYLKLLHLMSSSNIQFLWCRLFYLYGENEDPRRLSAYLNLKLKKNEIAELSDGNQVRDFLDVVVAGKMIAEVALGKQTGPINICSEIPITVREFAEKIAEKYDKKNLLNFGSRPSNITDPPFVLGISNLESSKFKK